MNKLLMIVVSAVLLAGCAPTADQVQISQTREDYRACINTSEGNPDKLASCQVLLNKLKQEKAHQQFAEQETVRVVDYQRCLTARKTGNGQAYAADCGKIWQEISANNSPQP
ncbi:ChiQ/YbfN family lipoprotein [Rahnella aquatilis]|uniref:ChiQ/YbfN family lipoprotein n=1 Tax=Rahnella aquatilis TaxID=34038 RepID=UPI000645E4E9|nr:ChiQ/YbfN family lipoprotein [Rahnella aquatilis]